MRVSKKWHGAVADEAAKAGAVLGLGLATEHLLTESRKIVPLEVGDLERSGVASVDDSELRGAVSFSGAYAVVQHERLDYRHAPGRVAKYLETPARDEAGRMTEIIAAQIRRALRS